MFVVPSASAQMGYSGADLQRMGQWLQFNGLTIYRLEAPGFASPYAAVLASGRHGWRIIVFLRDGGQANVNWDSGFLKHPFEVASTDDFVLVPQVGTNFGITFSGCKAHDCTEVYGALLYLPWSRQYFEKDVSGKSVACSQSLLAPRNAAALHALDAALRRQKNGTAGYVPPVCPGGAPAK